MNPLPPPPADGLERLFHEPSRLAIVAALCAAPDGLPFTALRDACHLTDGNLNRHLKLLQEAGVVTLRKRFVALRPRTTVQLTHAGRERFDDYLAALEQTLRAARAALPAHGRAAASRLATA